MPELRVIYNMQMEAEIQRRTKKKDKKFVLAGRWKKFVRKQSGFFIYAVNGEWVRNNLSVIFGHGGHGYVHEFIPLDELWISTRHFNRGKFNGCGCVNLKTPNQKVSQEYFDSTVIHEIKEFKEMERGKSFLEADQLARYEEIKAGLLADPDTEVDAKEDV